MATIEVELKEGDKEPEQHLDDGEHIERLVVPLHELYDKLQGECSVQVSLRQSIKYESSLYLQLCRKKTAKLWTQGKSMHKAPLACSDIDTLSQALSLGFGSSLEPAYWHQRLTIETLKDLAAQGFIPDIYVAFMAYGWYWGGKFAQGNPSLLTSG